MADRVYRSPHRRHRPDPEVADLILKVTQETWGCPRGDKFHHLTREGAQDSLQAAIRENPTHKACEVYQCPCGGWVYGRPWWAKCATTQEV